MHCPKCDAERFNPQQTCRRCGFSGDPALTEELSHLTWALDEIDDWLAQDVNRLTQVRRAYEAQRREIEVALDLRPPPLTADEARDVWPRLYRKARFLDLLRTWLEEGLLRPEVVRGLVNEIEAYVETTQQRLEHLVSFDFVLTDTVRLRVTNYLLERVWYVRNKGAFRDDDAYAAAIAPLKAQRAALKDRLGLTPEPLPEEAPATPTPEPALPEPPAEPKAPPQPRLPLRERLARSLLSERTLHAILFLGIFLLFSAAITFVIWGWRDFTPTLRVAIPPAFTLVFFAMGWYLRTRTTLSQSGVALTAVAALLIPVDFYTAYVTLDLMPGRWPQFWLLTSLVCLGLYLGMALRLQNLFFGYLVTTAAGSAVLAAIEVGHQASALSRDWYAAGLSALSLSLMLLAAHLEARSRRDRLRFYTPSLRTFALLTVGVLMPLALGWRVIDRAAYDALHWSATVTWWIGGFLLGWGAVLHRSRALGLISVIAPPVAVYLTQAALFDSASVNPAWHAFGWAWLVPLYVAVGRWLTLREDEALRDQGRTFNWVSALLILAAALWSLTDLSRGTAAAASHAVLVGAVALAAALWRRPAYLYGASFLALSAATFGMTELSLTIAQLSVGWCSLALLHVLAALALGRRLPDAAPDFAVPVVRASYAIAGLAVLLPLAPFDRDLDLALYALGHWIALTGWGAHLAHTERAGFAAAWSRPIFHWMTALPLPGWLWMHFTRHRPADVSLALALAALAWGMVALSYRLKQADHAYRWPWYLTGWATSAAAVVVAFAVDAPGLGPALTLLSMGVLAFADTVTMRQSLELSPAALVTAAGLLVLLDRLHTSPSTATFGLSLLIALYILAGLEAERRRLVALPHRFLVPLYLTAHALALYALGRVYARPLADLAGGDTWSDAMKLWGAATQLTLGVLYGLYAWGTYKERWGHVAAWLGTAGGGFLFIVYSRGRGSSAVKAALMVVAFVLAERVLHRLRDERRLHRRVRAFFHLAWRLYRRPFLVTGWILSAATIGLALIRNLWLLGSGRTRELWAIAGLLIITALYALSARLFRRPLFVWLASLLVFAPWTILTDLGWLIAPRPTAPGFAVAWAVLAWTLTLVGLLVQRRAPSAYAHPPRVVAHLLMPFALLWGVADAETSRITFGLAVAFYGLHAGLDHRKLQAGRFSVARASTWLYPALGLIPIWCVYLLAWHLPAARHEHHGLMLLTFAPLGLAAGEALHRLPPAGRASPRRYALPAYLTGYVALIVGTMLTAHLSTLLALVLLFDALLMLISAQYFHEPLWDYPAAALTPVSLLIALNEASVEAHRHGWWLLGLAVLYLALAWLLRRVRLPVHASPALAVGFALVALSLPPSSQDQVGALWGYGGAALLYALTAFWLRQPLLLTAACGLAVVPYAIALDRSALDPAYHGLALLPGAVAALTGGVLLDRRFGAWRDFPWGKPTHWLQAVTERVLEWWALPLYALGFGLACAAPFFTAGRADLSALNFLLLMPICGWALHRFRRRGWLLALALAGHLALARYLEFLGWWRFPAHAWLRFLPVTAATMLVALWIERRRDEGSPLALDRLLLLGGWSRPLYALAALDVALAQAFCLNGTDAAALVSFVHALLLALLGSAWAAPAPVYGATLLGAAALGNQLHFLHRPLRQAAVAFARLALGYGLVGFGLALAQERRLRHRRTPAWLRVWERPPQIAGLTISAAVLGATAVLGFDLTTWTLRALVGLPFRRIVDLATVRMVVSVLALLGLLYVAAAVVYRRRRLGYGAVGMLLTSWMIYAFYVQEWSSAARVQWYAVPAGLYLLGISALEWRQGHKALGRWLDYAALLLMMGSLFWQTLLYGWHYALMLSAEGLATLWWGSARRLRRFLYGGMAGVILATLGQLIHSLQSVLQWILVSVIVGLALFLLGAFVERHLGQIRDSLQEALETWE